VLAAAITSIPLFTYLMYSGRFPLLHKMNLNFALAPSVAVLLFCAIRYQTPFSFLIGNKAVVSLGNSSYSIYLLHILIFFAALGEGQTLPQNRVSVAFVLIRLLFGLAVICILALGLYRYVEAPSRRWLRLLWHRPHRIGVVTVAALVIGAPLILMLNQRLAIVPYDPYEVSSGINVETATYGGNCGAPRGNVTAFVSRACNGRDSCAFPVDVSALGDSAPGCGKSFDLEYSCRPSTVVLRKSIDGSTKDATGSTMSWACPVTSGLVH
jgi:hypothetical protein